MERLIAAFADAKVRGRWLPGVAVREGAFQPGEALRFDWKDSASRVVVDFAPSGKTKSQVSVQHQRLRDAKAAAEMKAFWRERLAALKTLLGGSSGTDR